MILGSIKKSFADKKLLTRLIALAVLFALFVILSAAAARAYSLNSARDEAMDNLSSIATGVSNSIITYTTLCDTIATSEAVLNFANSVRDTTNPFNAVMARQIQLDLNQITAVSDIRRTDVSVIFLNAPYAIVPYQFYSIADYSSVFNNLYNNTLSYESVSSGQDGNTWGTYCVDGRSWLVRNVYNSLDQLSAYIIVEIDLDELAMIPNYGQIVLIGSGTDLIHSNVDGITKADYIRALNSITDDRLFTFSGTEYISFLNVFSNVHLNVLTCLAPESLRSHVPEYMSLFISVLVLILIILVLEQKYHKMQMKKVFESGSSELENDMTALLPYGVGQLLQRLPSYEGSRAEECSKNILTGAGLSADQPFFIAGFSYSDDIKEFIGDMSNEDNEYIRPFFVLNNVLKDMVFEKRAGILAAADMSYVLLAQCLDTDTRETFDAVISSITDFFKNALDVTLISSRAALIDVSQLKETVESILEDVQSRTFWYGSGTDGHERRGGKNNDSLYFKLLSKMLICLENTDYNEAAMVFRQIIDDYLPTDPKDIAIARSRVYIMLDMLRSMTGINLDDFENFMEARSIGELKSASDSIFAELIKQYQNKAAELAVPNQRIENVKSYISEHFTESNLNVTTLAEQFNLNPSYLSRIFKEGTGYNLLDYIQRTRVEAAKENLKTMSVKEASISSGFWDIQGFTRVFKKFEGLTPSEYKRINQKSS